MCRSASLMLIVVGFVTLLGCTNSLPRRLADSAAPESDEIEPVPHPLSYQPIQLAAHSEESPYVDVDFEHRYGVFCVLIPEQTTVYRNCRILGTTGESLGIPVVGSFVYGGSKTAWAESGLFDDMLVLETEDGRRAYIPRNAVKYIEESAGGGAYGHAPPSLRPRS